MARSRLELQTILEGIMSEFVTDNKQHVWFQPPSSVYLTYPCIVYSLSSKDTWHANNSKYNTFDKYTITIMTRDPESPIPARVEQLKYCSFDRVFAVDGLWHMTYSLYF